jgi:hypothetical protein
VANLVYNKGKYVAARFPLAATSESLILMLVTTGYVESQDHDFVDDGTTNDPKSYEISVGGYARQTLANVSRFEDDTNDFAGIDADNVTFTSLVAGGTIGAGVLYRYSTSGGTTSDTGQELLANYTVTATPTNGGDITIAWASTSAGGVLKYGTTS